MFQKTYTVLLVDDEVFTRTLIGNYINSMPNIRLAADLANGFSAKRYLLEHPADIIITDIKMPLMDGLELAAFVKEFVPDCQVVIISAYGEFEYARKAIQYGVTDYLLKPVQLEQIADVLSKSCERIDEHRKMLLIHQDNSDKKLEDKLQKLLTDKKSFGEGKLKSGEVLKEKNILVRLCVDDSMEKTAEREAFIYKNILQAVLPGWQILRVRYEYGVYDYLCILIKNGNHRSIEHISEYLKVTLAQNVTFSVLCDIHSVEEMELFYANMNEECRQKEIETALRYMKEHLHENLSRNEVAEKVYLSPAYFSRLFKRVTGIGFGEYLQNLRMKQAQKLLAENRKVHEVAAAVGFMDVKYFSAVFYKKVGYLPAEYRSGVLRGEISEEDNVLND